MTSDSDKPVWMGFNDLSGFWKFGWSNNDPITKTYWAPGEPKASNQVGKYQLMIFVI